MSVPLRTIRRIGEQSRPVLLSVQRLARWRSPASSGTDYAPARAARVEALEPRLLLTGTTYVVDSLLDVVADDGAVTLREAIEAANTNTAVTTDVLAGSAIEADHITFDQAALSAEAGVAVGQAVTIILGGSQLEITGDLAIQGLGADVLTLNAGGRSRVLHLSGEGTEVELTGLTLTGGYERGPGGGIYNEQATLALTNSTVSGNSAYENGGGICNDQGTLTLTNCTVSENRAKRYSGWGFALAYGEVPVVHAGSISIQLPGDPAANGGAIYSSGELTVMNSTLSGNSAGSGGGVYSDSDGTLMVVSSTLSGNSAGSGGGLRIIGDDTSTVVNSVISGNSVGEHGGGIYNSGDGALIVTNSTVSGNWADERGGGIQNSNSTLILRNTIVALNNAPSSAESL